MNTIDSKNINEIILPFIQENYKIWIYSVERFETWLCHYVYDVILENWNNIVFRISSNENKKLLEWMIFWHKYLSELKIKIPNILHIELDCDKYFLPFIILERLKWDDLWNVFNKLSDNNLKNIAEEISNIQNKISNLNIEWNWFWFARFPNDSNLKISWKDLLLSDLDKAKKWINENKIFSEDYVVKVKEKIKKYNSYISQVKPKPFLDDITTKNVIINNWVFNWIVDFDQVCFWDKLYNIALIKMALLKQDNSLNYVSYLIENLKLSQIEIKIIDLYLLIFCVTFMWEKWKKFNKEIAWEINKNEINKLKNIFEIYYNRI